MSIVEKEERPAKKRPGRPKTSDRVDGSVKIDRRLLTLAKRIADHEGISVAEMLSEIIRAPIEKRYSKMLRDLDSKGQ